jgi:tetratricopeptide (TPR) repeat protein
MRLPPRLPRRPEPHPEPRPLRRWARRRRTGLTALTLLALLAGWLAGGGEAARAQGLVSPAAAPALPPAVAAGGPEAPAQGPAGEASLAELAFIERLYRAHDDYRAETEALRFLHYHPADPRAGAVELARAKLYYREGRYREAQLMLYSLLDRHPGSDAAQDARRLLTFAHLREGRPALAAETADALAVPGQPAPSLAELSVPPPGAVDPQRAETWSTWLPGSGYATLGEPGKAAVAVSLNLALLGAAVLSAQDHNAPAAALFLALEGLLWQGGRNGAREEAEAINRRLREQRTERWTAAHGEPALLGVGLSLRFGGG